MRRNNHYQKRNRQNQTVQRTYDDKRFYRLTHDSENNGGKYDKGDDEPAVIIFYHRTETADKRYGRICRADYGGDGRRPHYDTEYFITDIAYSQLKYGSRRIGRVKLEALRDNAERRQKQNDTHNARYAYTCYGTARNLRQSFLTDNARVNETMTAGKVM